MLRVRTFEDAIRRHLVFQHDRNLGLGLEFDFWPLGDARGYLDEKRGLALN